jgi:hypothetical protein
MFNAITRGVRVMAGAVVAVMLTLIRRPSNKEAIMRLRRRQVVVPAILISASLIAVGTASGTDTASSGADVVRSSSALAKMSQTTTSVKRSLLAMEGTVQPGTFAGAVGTCPKKFPTPVSGWFTAVSDKVVLAVSLPIGKHKWQTGVTSFDTVPSEFVIGVVCVK